MILSAFFFIVVIYFAIIYMRHFLWGNVLFCTLPLILFGSVFMLRVCDKISKKVSVVINIILIFVLSVAMFLNGIWMLFADLAEPTTNVHKYAKVLKIYHYPRSKYIKHFPKEIPCHAKNISFWENPQFLQGGSRILLMYETTPMEIEEYRDRYSQQAQIVLPKGKKEFVTNEYYVISIDDVLGKKLTDDFEIIILESKPYQEANWNHGYTYGLAINDITNEILFFSEKW